jgi:two-component system sensor histidine kinase ChvG
MLRQIKADADREKLISIIHHDVRRLDRLITDISDASRLDVELARETAEPVNLARLLATLCDVTRDTRAGSAVDIILRVEGCSSVAELNSTENYMTDGHDSRLSQVIVNLLDNAISFSPKGGKIFVSARRIEEDGEFEITVEDEGPGIPPDNLTKIFARFYTDRPESQGFGQNSGLGLNISEQIVKAHGGRIWAENRTSLEPVELAEKARGKGRKKRAEAVDALERASQGAAKTFGPRPSYGARFVIRLPFCAKGQSC